MLPPTVLPAISPVAPPPMCYNARRRPRRAGNRIAILTD